MSFMPQGRLEDEQTVGSDWCDSSPLDASVDIGYKEDLYDSPLYGDSGMPDDLYEEIEQIKSGVTKPMYSLDGLILDESPTCLPYRDDRIQIEVSPENLNTLITILKTYSINISSCESDKLDLTTLFNKQTQCRKVIEELDGDLNRYVRNRPWQPMLKKWVESIGKSEIRKGIDTWSV